MRGAALSAHLYWSSVALSGFLSGDLSSFSTLICKPGSGRFEGQTLLSSVRQKKQKTTTVNTSQSSKLHILDAMCLAQYVDCVPQNKEKTKKIRRQKTECVCACDYVPEVPDVYDYKDMLC